MKCFYPGGLLNLLPYKINDILYELKTEKPLFVALSFCTPEDIKELQLYRPVGTQERYEYNVTLLLLILEAQI